MVNRRAFLATIGAASAAPLGPLDLMPESGLVDPADYRFAKGLVYLQTGSLGPTPRLVMERTIAAWKELELDPVLYGYGPQEHAMDEVRAKAASFLGCATDELVLTRCTTDGMNWVAQGIDFKPGDRVLTTDQEHPGGRVCWNHVARRFGVGLDIAAIRPEEHDTAAIVARFASMITPRTRVLSFSHLLTSTGLRMPVAELSALARAHGCIAVVDGAQAAGGIAVDVKALGCHAYATSGHKWLLGPKGTGLLYLSSDLGKTVDPIALQAGRAAYSDSSGVSSSPSIIGLGAAIDYHVKPGMNRIETHNLGLRNRLYGALRDVPKLRVVSAPPGPQASPLLSYILPASVPALELHNRLRKNHHVVVKVVPVNWFNGQRISMHMFNSDRHVDALVKALKTELA
jgi:selenocysteine lyase/cysteine desulfurase